MQVFENKGTRRNGFFDLPEFPCALLKVGGGVSTMEWTREMVARGFTILGRLNHGGGYLLARKPSK